MIALTKKAKSNQTDVLKLTASDRRIILDFVAPLDDEWLETKLRFALADSSDVRLTLRQLDELARWVAMAAYEPMIKNLEQRFCRIGKRINSLQATFKE